MKKVSTAEKHAVEESPFAGLVTDVQWRRLADRIALSERELSVAKLLFEDRSREQIALLLTKHDGSTLSPETVRVYIDRMFGKLNARSPIQFVQRVIQLTQG